MNVITGFMDGEYIVRPMSVFDKLDKILWEPSPGECIECGGTGALWEEDGTGPCICKVTERAESEGESREE